MSDKLKIINIAAKYLAVGHFNTKIQNIVKASTFTDQEITYCLKYITQCQNLAIDVNRFELSIREMKEQIFRLIGQQPSNSYGSVLTKDDMRKMFNFITGLPSDYFIEDSLDELDD